MLERPALAIVSCALVLMALVLVRPSSGMRIVVLMLLLVGAALAGMTLGFRDLMSLFSGAANTGRSDPRSGAFKLTLLALRRRMRCGRAAWRAR